MLQRNTKSNWIKKPQKEKVLENNSTAIRQLFSQKENINHHDLIFAHFNTSTISFHQRRETCIDFR